MSDVVRRDIAKSLSLRPSGYASDPGTPRRDRHARETKTDPRERPIRLSKTPVKTTVAITTNPTVLGSKVEEDTCRSVMPPLEALTI